MKSNLFFLMLGLFAWQMATAESGWKEKRTVICTSDPEKPCLIQPGTGLTRTVDFIYKDIPAKRMLRVVGAVEMPAPYTSRGEARFRDAEFLIDDNLDSLVRKRDRYSLYFKGDNDAFEREAYYRIPGSALQTGELEIQLPVIRRNNLQIEGEFGLHIGIYYKKHGRAGLDIYDAPDSLVYIPIKEGTSRYEMLTHRFRLPEKTACLFLQLGGTRFSGECWVEAPRLLQHKKEVCPIPFVRHAQRSDKVNYWVGCNLSTRSWPMWKVEYNGKAVFQGPVFDRASDVADFYIPLPSDLPGRGELTLSLIKEDHRAGFPYRLKSMEIIEEPARDYEIISVPRYVGRQAAFGVLVETNRPDVTLKVSSGGNSIPAVQVCRFPEPGLHVIEFRAARAGSGIVFSFDDGSRKEIARVQQVIDKEEDRIYLSVGDDIYVDKEYGPYDYYFKWYLSQRAGNWYQFRPSYQWSGFRIADPEVIRHYTGLLNRLHIPYAWQVEGRTLAGSRINPETEDLVTPMFRGRQAHENDGGYYYWGHFKYTGLHSDLAARTRPYGGIFAKHRPIFTDHGTFIHYDPEKVTDMADGADYLVRNLQYSKGESCRHTGPSTLFRYFYKAGYDWLGAEQMYGPEEVILSSLRGASRAYYKKEYGSLHAMQWGSFPYTDPKHALRHYMSLALAYMHGSSHINTEDALWIDELGHDRYSASGKAHLFAQHQILDFIETHTRRGELKSNTAVIQGRNDAWKSFGRGNLWAQQGEKWAFNKACESFDLLKIFYPDNIINGCGPEGWFTSTPYGTVDLLPIEASLEVMKRYKTLVFLGWNTYDAADFGRLRDFVLQGGTLLLSAAHINAELQPDRPVRFPQEDGAVRRLLGDHYRQLDRMTVIQKGEGRIVYFPDKAYPAEESLKKDYEAALRSLAEAGLDGESEKGWIAGNGRVGFSSWDQGDRRTLYLLNIDWKSDADCQQATLLYGQQHFPLQIRRYHIETVHCAAGLAVHPMGNTTDILEIQASPLGGWKIRFQTTGPDTLRCMDSLTGRCTEIQADRAGIFEKTVN